MKLSTSLIALAVLVLTCGLMGSAEGGEEGLVPLAMESKIEMRHEMVERLDEVKESIAAHQRGLNLVEELELDLLKHDLEVGRISESEYDLRRIILLRSTYRR